MTWYIWKWWRLAWAAGPYPVGAKINEMGFAWICILGKIFFAYRTWKVIRIEVTDAEIANIPAGWLEEAINLKLIMAGAMITRGRFTKYYDTVAHKWHLWWEDHE